MNKKCFNEIREAKYCYHVCYCQFHTDEIEYRIDIMPSWREEGWIAPSSLLAGQPGQPCLYTESPTGREHHRPSHTDQSLMNH